LAFGLRFTCRSFERSNQHTGRVQCSGGVTRSVNPSRGSGLVGLELSCEEAGEADDESGDHDAAESEHGALKKLSCRRR
jgi:hypothetical protein